MHCVALAAECRVNEPFVRVIFFKFRPFLLNRDEKIVLLNAFDPPFQGRAAHKARANGGGFQKPKLGKAFSLISAYTVLGQKLLDKAADKLFFVERGNRRHTKANHKSDYNDSQGDNAARPDVEIFIFALLGIKKGIENALEKLDKSVFFAL